MDDMDWKAAINSEIFREYFANEINRMKIESQEEQKKLETNNEHDLSVLEQFKEFENQIRSSPKKLAVFKQLQNKFATSLEYTSNVKKSFVDAVMMLDLS